MGLGTHGGGVGAVRFLAECGARITLTESRSAAALASSLDELRDVQLERTEFGGHTEAAFRDAELVVVNPAVRYDHPLLETLRRRGTPVMTEVALLWRHTTARVMAVTGSVGKSTTVSMIAAIHKAGSRRYWLGGNIGGSLLAHVSEIGDGDWLVLELSSFQLAYLKECVFRPEVAVITNFSSNHLDWHTSLEDYRDCKMQLLRYQCPTDVAVLNGNDADVARWPAKGRIVWFRGDADSKHHTSPIDWSDMPMLRGNAMRENAAAAVAACMSIGVTPAEIKAGLASFQTLPHRFESLGVVQGREWINDSKGTTPAASIAAIRSCRRKPWVILGGVSKQVELGSFCESIADDIQGAALIGETSDELRRELIRIRPRLPHRVCKTIEEAVRWLADSSSSGDEVLLSPACASLDQFRDYAERGDRFRAAVMQLHSSTERSPCIDPAA